MLKLFKVIIIYIEVTDVRIDGKNISIDDLGMPEVVSECFEYEN